MFKWMKEQLSKLRKFEKGQALSEYAVTLPAAIMVGIVGAGAVGFGVSEQFREVILNLTNLHTSECPTSEVVTMTGNFGSHTIELITHEYDPDTDTTTIEYFVENGGDPSISHWVLGVEDGFAWNSASEQAEWVDNDPSAPAGNGISGVKFDTGYESSGGGGKDAGGPEKEDKGKPEDKGKANNTDGEIRMMSFSGRINLVAYYAPPAEDGIIRDGRVVGMTLTGQYDLVEHDVAIKAGTEYYTDTMAVPVIKTTTNVTDEYVSPNCGS